MLFLRRLIALVGLALLTAISASAQNVDPPRQLTAQETGCDTLFPAQSDSVYQADAVDQPVRPEYLHVDPLPLRIREVLRGQSTFRFIVEPSGKINRCSIVLQDETSRAWTAAMLKKLRVARYEPARFHGRRVRQEVYQMFTYDTDGRMSEARP